MNVLFVSQCTGTALSETRRILDQFAVRYGDRVWQTPITEAGLAVVARLLRKTARKNTAVACHWIRGLNHSELLWIVGNARRFNASGAVPTNTTRQTVMLHEDNDWHTAECCRLITAMAALWHDVGKIGKAFQKKLHGGEQAGDAFRHEWVSVRLFQAFVGPAKDDRAWLERLVALGEAGTPASAQARDWLDRLYADTDDGLPETISSRKPALPSPGVFGSLPPLAAVVAWLVLGHHHLPAKREGTTSDAIVRNPLKSIVPGWGYARLCNKKSVKLTWTIAEKDLPCFSAVWRRRAARLARRMLDRPETYQTDWFNNVYALHVSRMGLMLADHVYSSLTETADRVAGEASYAPYANTLRRTKELNQKLDEHLLGVERLSSAILWRLGRLRPSLPAVGALSLRRFRKRSEDARFRWQDKAFDLASALSMRSMEQGFLGINLASTGCGKTLANGRVCAALAGEGGLRFTVALGLRTLTLQTGSAYRSRLRLGEDELAVLAGDQAVRELYGVNWDAGNAPEPADEAAADGGSEAGEALFEGEVQYGGAVDGPLARWLAATRGAAALISAPVLACTIDHLVPATEGLRGGRQIAPMLRLMTSDLILDEPDDFAPADLYALSRLVYWAGMLGSRVILSSATITPSLAQGLFAAYREGREQFLRNRGSGRALPVICAWFDEFGCQAEEVVDEAAFARQHGAFVHTRLNRLSRQPLRRKALIVSVEGCPARQEERLDFWSETIRTAVSRLHEAHHTTEEKTGRRLSLGLIRMANIDPLVQTAQRLLHTGPEEGVHWHVCCYHARYPMLMRSALESTLDRLLTRKLPDAEFLAQPCVQQLFARSPARDHVVLVLATPVAEVGRDHDYDWAVVEPSSMRSLIQLAGRIRRHREGVPAGPNMYLLDRNLRALELLARVEHDAPAYCRPGFECAAFMLERHDLTSLLTPEQLARPDAGPRVAERHPLAVQTRADGRTRSVGNLADLEHAVLGEIMQGSEDVLLPCVKTWWTGKTTLSGEMQRKSRFRAQEPSEVYALVPDEQEDDCVFYRLERGQEPTAQQSLCTRLEVQRQERVSFLAEQDYLTRLRWLADEKDLSLPECALRFGRVTLPEYGRERGWLYHPHLGFARRD